MTAATDGTELRDPELRWLARSFGAHPTDAEGSALTTLARRLTNRAREVGETMVPLAIFRARLRDDTVARPRLLLEIASLHGYREELRERVAALREAAQAAQAREDERTYCDAILQLSLPIDHHVPFDERRGLAERGFDLARQIGDLRLAAFGAAAIAVMIRWLGGSPPAALRDHLEVYARASRTPEDVGSCLCYWQDWATQALIGGDYDEVREAMARATRFAVSAASADMPDVRLILLWRTGRWDEAMQLANAALDRQLPISDRALILATRLSIEVERSPQPDGKELSSYEDVFEPVDVPGSSFVHSVLTDFRSAMRLPRPAEAAVECVGTYVRLGIRSGWEDVLLSTANADPAAYRRLRAGAEGALPKGERAAAVITLADAVARPHGVPDPERVEAAAEKLLARGDVLVGGRALEEAARARGERGFGVTDLRRRSAEIYRELGADRSLANLLRRSSWPRDLGDFRVPASQFKRISAGLTRREVEVADLASRGYTTAEIGSRLSISPATAETHLRNLKRKLGVSRKSELVRLFERASRR